MTHAELKTFLEYMSEWFPNLKTPADRINKVVETMGRTNVYENVLSDEADRTKDYNSGSVFREDVAAIKRNVAIIEKMLVEKTGYKKGRNRRYYCYCHHQPRCHD